MALLGKITGTIRSRLLFGSLGLAVIPVALSAAALGYLATTAATESLTERAREQLAAVGTVKRAELGAYFNETARNLRVIAATPAIAEAMSRMPAAMATLTAERSATTSEGRDRLRGYYGGDFVREYQSRNAGGSIDMAARVASLPDYTVVLQDLYIAQNQNPLGKKNELLAASDGSDYSALHAALHPYTSRVVQQYGLYDIFLVDPATGRVVYTFFKELDYATSLLDGPYADTGLAEAFRLARESADPDRVVMTDYARYLPSYNDQALFASVPIVREGRQLGILIVQLPIDRINSVLTFNRQWATSGLGASGEVYIVGADKLARSQSRFLIEDREGFFRQIALLGVTPETIATMQARDSTIGLLNIDTRGVAAAQGGAISTEFFPDYRNVPILGYYAPLEIYGNNWTIHAEIDAAEALAPVAALRRQLLYAVLATVALLVLVGALVANRLSRSINKPIGTLRDTVARLNSGDFDARANLESSDELGQLGRAFDGLLDDRVTALAKAAKENDQLNESVIRLMQALGQLAQRDLTVKAPVTEDVTGAVSDAINLMVRETSEALRQVLAIATQVAQASTRVRGRSESVAEVANLSGDEARAASQELAQAADALRSIADLARRANGNASAAIETTQSALDIVTATVEGISASRDQIRETEKRIKRLGERSQEISTVVNIIGQIAERTSVLALNASMQAVAAGDAGRGFAVVADEVKRLAENARQATQQIAALVGAVQADASETVQAMNAAIAQVVDISRLAETAGDQMSQTRRTTDELVGAVREIANTTDAQARVSGSLMQRAQQLLDANEKTLAQLDEARGETANLIQYSKGLLDTVRVFKLPANAA
jgi:methyl-accepting chemotaxis protein